MAKKQLKRISLVVVHDCDDQTSKQILSGLEAFLKTNYKISSENIESHHRTIFVNGGGKDE